jgi:sortase A
MKLARVNTVLVVIIAAINLSIILLPLIPAVVFLRQKHSSQAQALLNTTERHTASDPNNQPIAATAEQLIVPSMVLDTAVHEGTRKALNLGVWRIPHSSTPDKGSNTVFVAHRYTYTNPRGTFYHLDKVAVGDAIAVLWHGKKYVYGVDSVRQVAPTTLSVEAPTATPTLTLYTCTPLWNPKDRLVVTATLKGTYER